jgi:hypothetical protein
MRGREKRDVLRDKLRVESCGNEAKNGRNDNIQHSFEYGF